MKNILLLIGWCSFLCTAWTQSLERAPAGGQPGELLIQLADDADIQQVVTLMQQQDGRNTSIFLKKTVAASWHVYLIGFDESTTDADGLWSLALHTSGVRTAQWNYTVQERVTPNDQKWSQQLDMTLIHAPQAWDVSTGGVTPNGDTIVVAVLEKGALLDHPDLIDNIWYNRKEIPNNNIDDDLNGYVDDYRGYDARFGGDGPGTIGFHGTAVNGIIGAHGNNDIGIAGVNWNVKLMNFSNVGTDAEIVAAYEYVVKMRRRYNQSNGQQGAFVVSSNASFGLDFAKAVDHPLWCAAYDSLGAVGVLSAGATSNSNVDVDAQGDMPSTCTSEYLLVVDNVNAATNAKAAATGYGKKSVDLGAPGERTYTTYSSNTTPSYNNFDGTSAATPHVSGAIALMYSLDCTQLTNDALTQPTVCARRVRDMILNNVEPLPSLTDITTTGGRLDLLKAVSGVRQLCEANIGPLEFLSVHQSLDHTLDVYFQTPTLVPYNFRVFNMLGQLMYEQKVQPLEFAATHVIFNAAPLPQGIYVMTLGHSNVIIARKFRNF